MGRTSTAASPGRLRDLVARHRHLVALGMATAVVILVVAGAFAWVALNDKHTEGRWLLESSDPALPEGLAFTIEGDEVHGKGPCNSFRARWSQDEGVSALAQTLMGCAPDRMLQEERYFALLNGVTSVEVEQDQMTLSGPAGSMKFARAD